MSKPIPDDVLAVLSDSVFEGNKLLLQGQLDRSMYTKVVKVIEAAGGKWVRKEKAHVFPGDAAAMVDDVIINGTVDKKKELGQFFTPAALAEEVVERAEVSAGHKVLEPSAGAGAIAKAARTAGGHVHCVDIDVKNVEVLLGEGFTDVQEADFLSLTPSAEYDRVVMNPPFARMNEARHVLHAFKFVKPGGRLVAIMSGGIKFRREPLYAELRDLVASANGYVEPLPERSFKESGTTVTTVMVSLNKAA